MRHHKISDQFNEKKLNMLMKILIYKWKITYYLLWELSLKKSNKNDQNINLQHLQTKTVSNSPWKNETSTRNLIRQSLEFKEDVIIIKFHYIIDFPYLKLTKLPTYIVEALYGSYSCLLKIKTQDPLLKNQIINSLIDRYRLICELVKGLTLADNQNEKYVNILCDFLILYLVNYSEINANFYEIQSKAVIKETE